jgi:hypothetical protein
MPVAGATCVSSAGEAPRPFRVWPLNNMTAQLFNLSSDPWERDDIAAQNPGIVAKMAARLAVLAKGFFTNSDDFSATTVCPADTGNVTPCGCWAALNVWGGYFGPWAWAPNATG